MQSTKKQIGLLDSFVEFDSFAKGDKLAEM